MHLPTMRSIASLGTPTDMMASLIPRDTPSPTPSPTSTPPPASTTKVAEIDCNKWIAPTSCPQARGQILIISIVIVVVLFTLAGTYDHCRRKRRRAKRNQIGGDGDGHTRVNDAGNELQDFDNGFAANGPSNLPTNPFADPPANSAGGNAGQSVGLLANQLQNDPISF